MPPQLPSFVRLTDPAARVEAGAFAVLSTGITVAAAVTDITAVFGLIVFIFLGALPYAAACAMSALRPYRRFYVYSARAALLCYGAFDVTIRYRAFFHPSGSTDAVVAFALPVLWAPAMTLVCALLMLAILTIWSAVVGRSMFD